MNLLKMVLKVLFIDSSDWKKVESKLNRDWLGIELILSGEYYGTIYHEGLVQTAVVSVAVNRQLFSSFHLK